jgi:hypothetical protein
MSKKSKLIIGIILLAVGGILVPTGYFVNNYLREQVSEGVPEALLKIQADAVPGLEEQIPGLATDDVLLSIEAQALVELQNELPYLATPDVLLGLKAEIEDKIPGLINCTTTANVINMTIAYLMLTLDFDTASNLLFNDPTFEFSLGFATLKGVSNFTGVSMGYTSASRQALLIDGISIPGVGDIAGLINDTTLGTGVCGFLEVYNASLYDLTLNQTIQTLYNATWIQLTTLAGWFQYHVFPDIVPGVFQNRYGIPTSVAELYGFYFQWANGTLIEDGIDLSVFLETYDIELKGLEAGVPTPTNIPLTSCISMWDPTNSLSFVNETGIFAWLNTSYQTTIEFVFSINSVQYSLVLGWLVNFITNLTPILLFEETGYTVPELAQLAFYEQWAEGTINGESVLPEGFLSQLSPLLGGTPYFEVGLTTGPTGLTSIQCADLWDEGDVFALVNGDGILVWLAALTNTSLYPILEGAFSLSTAQRAALLSWLGAFYTVRIPQLLQYETGYTVPELAQNAFYEQWANGTINGEIFLPEGFLSLRDPPYYGPPYFEIALTLGYKADLTVFQCEQLWNILSNTSLVTVTGINKWYDAKSGNTIYTTLAAANGGLTNAQMDAILAWLPKFRDKVVNTLAKDDKNLPMTPYDLGSTLFMSLGIAGGALAAMGVIVLILSKRSL